jgi:hypothetical protein
VLLVRELAELVSVHFPFVDERAENVEPDA